MQAFDYRSSAWSLRDALAADDALDRLEARPIAAENRAAIAAARFAIDARAKRRTGDALVARGFRHLGTKRESASYKPASVLDVFVDRDETTYVTIRRRPTLLPLSKHYVLTYFDDGSCIETVARADPLYRSDGPLTVRAGCGDLIGDVERHLAAVRERARTGARIVRVRDLGMVLRLARYFVTHVCSTYVAACIADCRRSERQLAGIALALATIAAIVIFGR